MIPGVSDCMASGVGSSEPDDGSHLGRPDSLPAVGWPGGALDVERAGARGKTSAGGHVHVGTNTAAVRGASLGIPKDVRRGFVSERLSDHTASCFRTRAQRLCRVQ